MKNSKLIYFLRLLPRKELTEFNFYLECPLFQHPKVLPRLLEVIVAHCLEGICEDDASTRKTIYHEVYGKRPFNAQTLKTNLSQLLMALRGFMAMLQFRRDSIAMQRYFLKHLNSLQDGRYFDSYHEMAMKELAQADPDHLEVFHERLLLDTERVRFERQQTGRVSNPTMQLVMDNLEQGLLKQLLRGHLDIYSSSNMRPSSPFMTALLQVQATQAQVIPAIVQVYSRLYRAQTADHGWQEYLETKTLCEQLTPRFSPSEHKEVQAACLDYAIQKLLDGDSAFVEEVFMSYDLAQRSAVFSSENSIRGQYFRAFIVASVGLGKLEWAAALHKEWQGRILGDTSHHADQFAQAVLAFYHKDYGSATLWFQALVNTSDDVHDAIQGRLFLLMCHYETADTPALESLFHSFRMFLNRNSEVSAGNRKRCIAFINHLRRFMNIPLADQQRLWKLRKALRPMHPHAHSYLWLQEQIADN